MAFWRDDLLLLTAGLVDDVGGVLEEAEEEEEDVIDGRTKSLTQARDNLLQFVVEVVAAILFSRSAVYLISFTFDCSESCVLDSTILS